MMMKKTTSALAVAALLGTGAATAATFQVDENTSMSITAGIYTAYVSVTDGQGNESTKFGDNASAFIFSSEHTADNGLTTFANMHFDGFDSTEAGSSSADSIVLDEASMGVRGDFGEVLVGSNGGVYDEFADFADGGTIGWSNLTNFSNGDVSDVIQYSNSAGNLSYKLQAQVGDETGNTASNGSSTSLGGGASLDLGGATLSAAYEQRSNQETDDEPIFGIGASTTIGGASITAGYEVEDNAGNDIDKMSLSGSYPVGPVTLVGIIQNTSFDTAPTAGQDDVTSIDQDDDSFTEVQIGASYSVTSQMSVTIETVMKDRKNDESDFTGVGMNYTF